VCLFKICSIVVSVRGNNGRVDLRFKYLDCLEGDPKCSLKGVLE
jgi:hypothetical protein